MMRTNRRNFLHGLGATTAMLICTKKAASATDDNIDYELVAQASSHSLYQEGDKAPLSELWTYNKETPGPEVRIKRGERVRIKLVNKLDVPTTIHWHGIRIENAMDGVSGLTQEPVQPGGSFVYDFVAPDAGSFWYHAHHRSWEQVARGLYGPLIVEEPEQTFDRDHEITMILDDWRLDNTGTLQVASMGNLMDWSHGGRLGNWLTVNSQNLPSFTLRKNEQYRVRLINVCNARMLEIDPNKIGAKILALDGMPFATPEVHEGKSLVISPSQRVDLLVSTNSMKTFELEEVSTGRNVPIAKFVPQESDRKSNIVPALPAANLPEPDLATGKKITVRMSGGAMGDMGNIVYQGKKLGNEDFRTTRQLWALNGIANLSDRPLFSVKKGETVIIETFNDTVFAHAMHIHGHHFKIIEGIDTARWRDTFLVLRSEKTKVAFVADNPGKWLFHCHMLEHAAAGMNSWFEVV